MEMGREAASRVAGKTDLLTSPDPIALLHIDAAHMGVHALEFGARVLDRDAQRLTGILDRAIGTHRKAPCHGDYPVRHRQQRCTFGHEPVIPVVSIRAFGLGPPTK